MKKILLFAAAALVATAANAQKSVAFKNAQVKMNKSEMQMVSASEQNVLNTRLEAKMFGEEGEATATPRRSAATNLYYTRPSGIMYYNWNKEGSGYGPTYVVAPSREDLKFTNKSDNPTTNLWHFNYLNNGSYRDLTQYAEANGDYITSINPGYYFAAPTLVNAEQTDSFCIGKETNSYWSKGGSYASYFTRFVTDSLFSIGAIDDHCSMYGWGSLSSGYLYGSGTLTSTKFGNGTCIGIVADFNAPAVPLYVEDMFLRGKCQNEVALGETDTLTAYIYNPDTYEIYGLLTATAADVEYGDKSYTSSYAKLTGTYKSAVITFSQKTVDPLSGETVAEPFVIDGPYSIEIYGLDGATVDWGFNGAEIQDQDVEDVAKTYFMVNYPDYEDAETGKKGTTRYHYYTATAAAFTFNAMFDDVVVADSLSATDKDGNPVAVGDCNYVVVTTDGTATESYMFGSGLAGAYVTTQQNWFNESGDEYISYDLDEVPEWITGMAATAYGSYDNCYLVSFTAEALTGADYRYAKVNLKTRGGLKSKLPVYVIQGKDDAAVEAAYAAIKAEEAAGISVVSIDNESAAKSNVNKIVKNGQVVIVKNGLQYNVAGARVK